MGTKLYVGNLNYNTTEDTLRQAFSQDGRQVTSVAIIMDRETGRPRGFAFVEMATPEAAQQALQALDGQELDGRMLRINEAREREPRGPGGPRPFSGPRPGGPPTGPRPGGFGGPPSGGFGGPRPGGFGGPRPGGFGGPPSCGFRAGPPGGPPSAPGRRGRKDKDKEKEKGGDDDRGGKRGRRRDIDDDMDW